MEAALVRNVGTIPIGICSDDPATHSLCVHSERPIMTSNSFNTRDQLTVGEKTYEIHRLDRIEGSQRLPYSLKVLLENLLRNEDGRLVTAEQIAALHDWTPADVGEHEIQYTPARVLMQDFTGVPCVVDLVAMRDAITELGAIRRSHPLIPAELVIDHSVIADVFARSDAFGINAQKGVRTQPGALSAAALGTGVVHGLPRRSTGYRHLPPGQPRIPVPGWCSPCETVDGLPQAYPDTLVGTDSHTPMVNGLGVLGWGVGGIEAEAAMLGQPMSMLIPEVVGLKLTGQLPEGTTATDLVLTVAQLLRQTGVVGKFVEFFGAIRTRTK